jgi:hypothetical protein
MRYGLALGPAGSCTSKARLRRDIILGSDVIPGSQPLLQQALALITSCRAAPARLGASWQKQPGLPNRRAGLRRFPAGAGAISGSAHAAAWRGAVSLQGSVIRAAGRNLPAAVRIRFNVSTAGPTRPAWASAALRSARFSLSGALTNSEHAGPSGGHASTDCWKTACGRRACGSDISASSAAASRSAWASPISIPSPSSTRAS